MKKKGGAKLVIGILIAIIFIVLSLIVYVSARSVLNERVTTAGKKINAINNLDLRILDIYIENDNLKISLENAGQQEISSFIVKIISSDNEESIADFIYLPNKQKFKPADKTILSIPAPFGLNIENYKSVEVIPKYEFNGKEETANIKSETVTVGGGSSGGSSSAVSSSGCSPSWQCSSWSECLVGEQIRACSDSNNCNNPIGMPLEAQICSRGTTVIDNGNPVTIISSSLSTIIIYNDTLGIPPAQASTWPYEQGKDILRNQIKNITGITLEARRQSEITNPSSYNFRIYVGRGIPELENEIGDELDKLDEDGYIIKFNPSSHNLYLAGKFSQGNSWAAYDFLERFTGARWYGGLDTYSYFLNPLPSLSSISIPDNAFVESEPSFQSRREHYTMSGKMTKGPYRLKARYGNFHHNIHNLFPLAKYGDYARYGSSGEWVEYREYYYPLRDNGAGGYDLWIPPPINSQNFQPRIADERVINKAVNDTIAFFNLNPYEYIFSLAVADNEYYCDWSADETYKNAPAEVKPLLNTRNKKIAYSFAVFYNRVAAELRKRGYSNKKIGYLAYGALQSLPVGSIKLDPMLYASVTTDSAHLYEEREMNDFNNLVETWKNFGASLGMYEYLYGCFGDATVQFAIPRIYNNLVSYSIKNWNSANAVGFYAEVAPNWGLDGPKYWLVYKLLWDSSQNPDILLDDYYSKMFGPVSQTMKNYFTYLENVWITQDERTSILTALIPDPAFQGEFGRTNYRWGTRFQYVQFEIFRVNEVDTALAFLNQALAEIQSFKAGASGSQLEYYNLIEKRINFFKTTFELTKRMSYEHSIKRNIGTLNAEPYDYGRIFSELNKLASLENLRVVYDRVMDLYKTTNVCPLYISVQGGCDNSAKVNNSFNIIYDVFIRSDTLAQYSSNFAYSFARNLTEKAIAIDSSNSLTGIRQATSDILDEEYDTSESSDSAGLAYAKNLADSGLFYVRKNSSAMNINLDGNINSEEGWGDSVFDGYFYKHPLIDADNYRTKIYAVEDGKKLYLAFDMEGNPDFIGGNTLKIDSSNSIKDLISNMTGDDTIIVSSQIGWSYIQKFAANVNGAFFDDKGNGVKMNATQVEARKTSTGWQLEMIINYTQTYFNPSNTPNHNDTIVSIVRYSRVSAGDGANYKVVVSSIVPIRPTNYNIPSTMIYIWGSRPFYERYGN